MKQPLAHLANMIFNEPLAILPAKLEAILRAIGPRLTLDDAALQSLIASGTPIVVIDPATVQAPAAKGDKPYRLTPEGIAIIRIRGTLMKRFDYLMMASGCMSYAAIAEAAGAAMADPNVKGILLDIDSPGGSTHGCFELSENLFNLRVEKPLWAIANDLAASAAYALASAANRVLLTRTAGIGSVGVFALHADQSGLDEQQGVKYSYIYAGEKKVDGNPHEPLSKAAKSDIQAEVDREYGMFVECVARNRDLTAQQIRNTEAAIFFGETAVVGLLADQVATFDDALAEFSASVNTSPTIPRKKMAVASHAISDHNAPNGAMESSRHAGLEEAMPAIAPHKTATSEKPWDGPKAKANLRNDGTKSYYRSAFAWQDPNGDATTKAAYKFIHHEVSGGGDVGAANIKACQSSIGILNGGRGGTLLTGSDRRGTYRHVAAHLRDAKLEPAPLAQYAEYVAGVLAEALEQGDTELHALALQYLLADGAEESTVQGEELMPLDTLIKRGKKSEPEDTEAKEPDEDEEDEGDDEDKEEEEEEDDKKKGEAKSRKGESVRKAKSRRLESKKEEDDSCDEMEGRKSAANGAAKRIASLCQLADMPELAVQYIGAGFTVDQVMDDLSDRRSTASAESSMHSYVSGQPAGNNAAFEQALRQAQVASAQYSPDSPAYAQARYQAMSQALRLNPQIYEGYMDERDRVIQASPSGRGPMLEKYVLGTQRRYMMQLGLSTAMDEIPARKLMA